MKVKDFGVQVCKHCLGKNMVVKLCWINIIHHNNSDEPLINIDIAELWKNNNRYDMPID